MPYPIDLELAQTVIAWISQTAHTENIAVISYPDQINRDGDWLYVPLSVHGEDAYDRASRLQRIEEHWDPTDHDDLHLLLVPAKPKMPTQNEGYAQLSELMQRQRQIIDQINNAPSESETVQRFQAVRQIWESTIRDMERLHPSVKSEVP